MKKKKVVFVTPFFYPTLGGVETNIYYTAKELMKLGWKVEVFTSDMDRDVRIHAKEELYNGIKIRRFRTWLKLSFVELIFPRIFPAVIKSDADIIHIHTYRHSYNLVSLITRKPTFLTPHWPIYKGQRSWFIQFLVNFVDAFLGKLIFKSFDKVCTVTGLEKKWVKKFGVKDKDIILTPNCLPKEYFKDYNGENFRKKHGIGDKTLVITMSRIHKSKGIDQIVKVAKYFPETEFVIVGKDDGFLNELKDIIKKDNLDNVQFTGRVSEKEKMEAYTAADIFSSPSHYEAFGITTLEAMSKKCAVLTSRQGGLPWVVDDAGLTYPINNLKELRKQLTKLIENEELREKFQKRGFERSQAFRWEDVAKTLDKQYTKVINEK